MGKRLTHEEFIERLLEKSNKANKIEILSQYKGNKIKVDCKCKDCGFEWSTTPKVLYKGHGCKMCISKINGQKLRKTHEEFLQGINPNIEVLSQYTESHSKVKCLCKICGNKWDVLAYDLTNGYGCPECSKEIKRKSYAKTQEEFIKEFYSKYPNAQNISISGEYLNQYSVMKCECSKCKGSWEQTASSLLGNGNKYGCPICTNKRVCEGINDIATVRPDLVKYFQNPEDAKKYTTSSHTIVDLICPFCHSKKKREVRQFVEIGISCDTCGGNISYPNKFSYSFLSQLPIKNHIKEYSPDWIKPKRYDNYFEYNGHKYILEMDGAFHYQDAFGNSKEEIQRIDRYKDLMAEQNGIEVIRIECKRSIAKYIKNNLLHSRLAEIFDLSNYDWDKCISKIEYNSYVPVWEYANNNLTMSIAEIANDFKRSEGYIKRVIQLGVGYGTCNYKSIMKGA